MSDDLRQLHRLGTDRIPMGWTLSTVGDACTIRNDLRLPLAVEVRGTMQGNFRYYGPTGVLDYINECRVEGDFALIGEDGDHFLDVNRKPQTLRVSGKFNVNNHAHIVGAGHGCSVDWFHYFFLARDISHSLTRQGAGRYKLTKAALTKLPILLPPMAEQRKIAEILRTCDEAIEKLDALRASKKCLYEACSAELIYCGGHLTQPLREHLTEVSERNRGQQVERVLSVTNSIGFVLADEHFSHRVASADISNYKIVRRGQFAYNPSRINVGSIARLDAWDDGALSPMYVVFEVQHSLNPDFFSHWLHSTEARKRIALSAQGSVRDTVSFGDLASIFIPVPPRELQDRVADALNACRDEIQLLGEQLRILARQKRGLMQKLLTGKWRVNLEGAGL